MPFRSPSPSSLLLAIVTLSYEQTIHAYPGGGGAYIVARDNLGELPAQIAGAALLTDYILTVAVSISSGVAQIISAFPALYAYRVEIAVGLVLFMMLINLRGVRESGAIFAIPTYFFLVMMFLTVVVGLIPLCDGHAGAGGGSAADGNGSDRAGGLGLPDPARVLQRHDRPDRRGGHLQRHHRLQGAAQPQRRHHADLDVGRSWASSSWASPSCRARSAPFLRKMETVISQLARTVFGGRNAALPGADRGHDGHPDHGGQHLFRRLPAPERAAGHDGFLPRQLAFRGSRLVYSRGIVALALIACLLIIVFQASVTGLIPLYAIGVFLSFTLSQAGMARRWWKVRPPGPGPGDARSAARRCATSRAGAPR